MTTVQETQTDDRTVLDSGNNRVELILVRPDGLGVYRHCSPRGPIENPVGREAGYVAEVNDDGSPGSVAGWFVAGGEDLPAFAV